MDDTPGTVRELLDARAPAHRGTPFLIAPDTGQVLDYGVLARVAGGVARHLHALGLEAGDKVAFLLDNGYWATAVFLGTMYGDMVTVPLNAVAGSEQMRYVLEHSDARVLLVSPAYRERFAGAIEGATQGLRVVLVDELVGPDWPLKPSGPELLRPPSATDHALLLYTSGTTGRPKGAELSHANVLAGGANTAAAHQLSPRDRALCVLPLYHINGEMVTVMGPLVSGGGVVMPRRFSASRFWELIAAHVCTWASVVPTIVSYLLDRAGEEPYRFGEDERLRGLRFVRSASAPLSPAAHEAFERTFKVPMIETMGLTETCAPILSNPLPPAPRKVGSPGIPFGNEVRVVDARGAECAPGVAGELQVRGPNVLARYYKNEQATAVALRDGWLRTGDLGYRDADGYFFITGRLKELIIKGGENIAPREIDDALYRHPAVLEAAAIGVPHPARGQDVAACVVLRAGFSATEEELRRHCAKYLGDYKTPSAIHFLDELPKGPSGKIQRLRLAEIVAAMRGTTA